ncbi:MAG: M3 family oligoendopeptidase [Candidatus Zixiibacteriota bacterium]
MSTTVRIPPAPRWDLDSIFPGGSSSPQFKAFCEKVRSLLADAGRQLQQLPEKLGPDSEEKWRDFMLLLQEILENAKLVKSFAGMLGAQDVSDSGAVAAESVADELFAEWNKLKSALEAHSLEQTDAAWEKLVTSEKLSPIRFFLDELREEAKSKMPVEQETLALDLAVSGYHAWNRLYDKLAGELRAEFPVDGQTRRISMGQLATKIADPDRNVRRLAFEKLTGAWDSVGDLAAMILNSMAGFRLSLYKARKWDSVLFEPLLQARMSREALDTMWAVVARENQKLLPYIEAKKALLGIDKYTWYDEFAPVGASERIYAFDEAIQFVVDNTRSFSPALSEFCRSAAEKRWIEAEDRPGKRAGAFCTGTGPLRQTRVFMTYAGSYDNLLTLAHELGHAYHNHVLRERPFFATLYPMPLAETASIFNELLVTDAALQSTDERGEKLMYLDQKLQSAYVLMCDIHCRYLFDCAFYDERRKGVLSRNQLNELMVQAQKQAYGRLLDESGYHPLFWASKLHFFLTDRPFYNYPYMVGYLFATGVYDRARKEGPSFAKKYVALLEDTGSMSTDDVARKHLGVDLKTEDFWQSAIDRALADVAEFVKLTGVNVR